MNTLLQSQVDGLAWDFFQQLIQSQQMIAGLVIAAITVVAGIVVILNFVVSRHQIQSVVSEEIRIVKAEAVKHQQELEAKAKKAIQESFALTQNKYDGEFCRILGHLANKEQLWGKSALQYIKSVTCFLKANADEYVGYITPAIREQLSFKDWDESVDRKEIEEAIGLVQQWPRILGSDKDFIEDKLNSSIKLSIF